MNDNDQSNVMRPVDPKLILKDLMLKYGQDVWNYAYFLTKSKIEADDISQDVFLNAYKHLSRFEHRSSVKTWLLTITRNRSLNYLTSSFLKRVTITEFVTHRNNGISAEREAIDRLSVNHIWECVLKLPVKYREVLVMDAHYQLSYSEISSILGIAEGTVKSRLHRARKKVDYLLKGAQKYEET